MSRPRRDPRPPHASPNSPAPLAPAWTSWLAGGLALAIGLGATPFAAGDRDGSELTVALATLGVAHPTGYALWVLAGHAWVTLLHALGAGVPWAANTWSVAGAAVALGCAHALGRRLLAACGVAPRPAALVAALPVLALAANASFAAGVTVAEVYSWHVGWVLGAALFVASTLDANAARRGDAAWRFARAAAAGALLALGVSHHASAVAAALPFALALAIVFRPRPLEWLGAAAAAALVLALAWGFVLWRSWHPAPAPWPTLGTGVRETWRHVTAAGYRHYIGGFAPSSGDAALLARDVWPWLVPSVLAAIAWPWIGVGAPRASRFALSGATLAMTLLPFGYGVVDPLSYFLAPLALALALLPAVIAAVAPLRRAGLPLAVLATLVVVAASWGTPGAIAERNVTFTRADEFLREMWSKVPIGRGWVIFDDDIHWRLVQYQQLDGQRRGLVVVEPRVLMDAGARALFARRHGVDPLGGAAPPDDAVADRPETIARFADTVARALGAAGPDSVVLFRPEVPEIALLPRPAAAADTAR